MPDRDVLIDVSRLIWRFWRGGAPTGVDRVCLAYVEHFDGRAQAVLQRRGRYFILTPDHSDELFDLFLRGPNGFRPEFVKLGLRALGAARSRPAKEGLLYFNVGHTGLDEPTLSQWIRRGRIRAIFLIHDLIPLLHPEYCRPGEKTKHERRMRNVLNSACGLIGNSQATIDDVSTFALANGMRMPPAVAAWIAGPDSVRDVRSKTFSRPHFVVVGTIEARKNHILLLHIWKRLVLKQGASAPLLVIVGQRGWEAGQTLAMLDRAVDLKDHVIELGKCDDTELARLIAGARALLMPSFSEGFGLPISEALHLGTPVIASELPVFREFAGAIPTYLDPLDGIGWESAIMSFTTDSPEWKRQQRALRGYRAPDWAAHFKLVEQWLRTLP